MFKSMRPTPTLFETSDKNKMQKHIFIKQLKLQASSARKTKSMYSYIDAKFVDTNKFPV